MIVSNTHFNKALQHKYTFKRIISLCPSITETLCDLNLEDSLEGISSFCNKPMGIQDRIRNLGGPRDVKAEDFMHYNPDLVILSKEETRKSLVESIINQVPLLLFDIQTVNDSLNMILFLGKYLKRTDRAEILHSRIKKDFEDICFFQSTRVVYIIWKDPLMAAGSPCFIDDMLSKAGFTNAVSSFSGRYPNIENQLASISFDLLLLSSEPYPFGEKDRQEFTRIFPNRKILLVDGEIFAWYGSRMQYARAYFKRLASIYRNEL